MVRTCALSSALSVTHIILNVTDRASVNAAAQAVSTALEGSGLDGLVNVAGVGKVAPVEYVTQDGLLETFNINLFGQIGVTQALIRCCELRTGES